MMNDELKIENVWLQKTDLLINEIVAFWESHRVMPPGQDPFERAKQVVLTVRKEHNIVGITTAYKVSYAPLKNEFYAFRGMIDSGYRVPGLFIKMTINTIKLLEEFVREVKDSTIGVITELENPDIQKLRSTRLASGLTLVGFSKKNNPIYVYYFKNTKY